MGRYSIILLTYIFFLFPALCRGQENVSPIVFEETHYDFGTAREDGGELVHVFRFRNTGRDTVMITYIRTLCNCTRGEASSRVVLPGAGGSIKVTFNPYGYTGEQYKGVTVVTDRKTEYKLTFSVNLIPRKKPVEEEYPVAVGSGLRIDKAEFTFFAVETGKSASLSLHFANVSGRVLRIETGEVSGSGLLSVVCPESSAPGEKGEIVMTYDAAGAPAGFYSDSFVISSGGGKAAVKTEIIVTDDFSGLSESSPRPSMRIGGTYVNIGSVQASSGIRRVSYTVRNDGAAPLTIRDVLCPAGLSVSLGKGMSVAPGASRDFDILLDAGHFPEGALFETVKILSDDPSFPVKDLMIAAKIVK